MTPILLDIGTGNNGDVLWKFLLGGFITILLTILSFLLSLVFAILYFFKRRKVFKIMVLILSIFDLCALIFLYFGYEVANKEYEESGGLLDSRNTAITYFFVYLLIYAGKLFLIFKKKNK